MPMGALASTIDSAGVAQDEFRAWYDTESFPARQRCRGFVTASRWVDRDRPQVTLGFYDLSSVEVLDAEDGYRAIGGVNFSPWSRRILGLASHVERYEAEQLTPGDLLSPQGAGGLYMVGMNVVEAAEAEFNRWYDEEHLPAVSIVGGVLAARRYRTRVGPQRYVAVYHLADPSIPGGQAWRSAVETTRYQRMMTRTSDHFRTVYVPYDEPS